MKSLTREGGAHGLRGCGRARPVRFARGVLVLSGLLTVLGAPVKADDAYSRSCASCHGPELRGGETGPALIGSGFQEHWAALAPEEFERFVRKTMPPTNPGSLSDADYAAAVDRIRAANGWAVASR
ncbi:MAG TPA: cytochrome c, partial [Steroidobacteraceae bacterium]